MRYLARYHRAGAERGGAGHRGDAGTIRSDLVFETVIWYIACRLVAESDREDQEAVKIHVGRQWLRGLVARASADSWASRGGREAPS